MNSVKDELDEIRREIESNLTMEEVAAQKIVKLERKYYYGDSGNNKRLEELRKIVAACADGGINDSPEN